jgi:hypothetical protein
MMDQERSGKVHWSFWAIGLLGLVWNAMGMLNLAMQMNPANLATMPELFRAIVETRPLWATLAFGFAVVSGALGCILLLMHRSSAKPVFVASLVAMVAHMFSYLGLSNPNVHFGVGDIILIVVMPIAVAVFLLWYAMQSERRRG